MKIKIILFKINSFSSTDISLHSPNTRITILDDGERAYLDFILKVLS